jgi:hypothetical protein
MSKKSIRMLEGLIKKSVFGVNLGVNWKKLKFGGWKLDFKKFNWSNQRFNCKKFKF